MSQAFKPNIYLRPETEAEVSEYLKKYGERSRIIAGGTGIYEVAHRGLLSDVEVLIDITRLSLSYIKQESDRLLIGACTTMSSMIESTEMISHAELAAIKDALNVIQPLQVKNVATIAGAVCTSLPFFDLPVALLSLDAKVTISPQGRQTELSEFIQGYFAVDLGPGEFVREVELPLAKRDEIRASGFEKFAMTGDDWALVNCGVSLKLDNAGKIRKASIAYGGGVGERPKRVTKIEELLAGVSVSDEHEIRSIFESNIASELEFVSDIRASAEYRTQLAKVLGRRAVLKAGERAFEWKGN